MTFGYNPGLRQRQGHPCVAPRLRLETKLCVDMGWVTLLFQSDLLPVLFAEPCFAGGLRTWGTAPSSQQAFLECLPAGAQTG